MKKFFKVISLSVIFMLLLESFSMIAYANDSPSKYAENCFQFDMEKITFYVENNKDVKVQLKEDNNLFNKIKMNKQKEKFQIFLNNYPDIERQLIDMVNKNDQIVAFGYTEAELVVDDYGNMIRVEDEKQPINNVLLGYTTFAADETAKGDSSKKYYFSLVTTVTKRGSKNPYTYQTVSTGAWSENSSLSGQKYPAGGNDFILQATPSGIDRTSDYLTVKYNHGKTPEEGFDYNRDYGNSNYIRYSVKDDPSGIDQMSSVKLIVGGTGNTVSYKRMVNSYYVHTWQSLNISVSASASANNDKKYGVSLTITPSIANKSWQVYSYVSFDF